MISSDDLRGDPYREAGYREDGVWYDGLWEGRAHVAHGHEKGSDPSEGPRGQAPIGPRNELRQMAGVWERRAQHHREDLNGHVPPEVGKLGHVRRDANRHDGRWEARAEWGRGRVHPKLEHKSDIHEGRWDARADFKGRPTETPQEMAARKAAANRAYVHLRDADASGRDPREVVDAFAYSRRDGWDDASGDANGHARARTGRGGRPTWAGDSPARNLVNVDNGPSPAWNAPTVAMPVGTHLRRKAEALREEAAAAGRLAEEEEGNFVRWMAKGDRGYTRTPADLRHAYNAADAGRGVDNVDGSDDVDDAGEAVGEAQREGPLSGLASMASVREAVKSVAAHAAAKASRAQTKSHVGVVQ